MVTCREAAAVAFRTPAGAEEAGTTGLAAELECAANAAGAIGLSTPNAEIPSAVVVATSTFGMCRGGRRDGSLWVS
jgi:hypothetical protein